MIETGRSRRVAALTRSARHLKPALGRDDVPHMAEKRTVRTASLAIAAAAIFAASLAGCSSTTTSSVPIGQTPQQACAYLREATADHDHAELLANCQECPVCPANVVTSP